MTQETQKSRLLTTERMSNTGYHENGKPKLWARANDEFIEIPETRGDKYLDCIVDLPVGTKVSYGAGKSGSKKIIRDTTFTVALS